MKSNIILSAIVISLLNFSAISYADDDGRRTFKSTEKYNSHSVTISQNTELITPDFISEQNLDGLTEDQKKTLLSIRLIKDTTTYMMTYYGSYGIGDDIEADQEAFLESAAQKISCSTFSATTPEGEPIFAYNNDNAGADWMMVIFADPPDGYATMCITSTRFCGIRQYAQNVDNLYLRNLVLTSPLYSFDGINEYGVTLSPMNNAEAERVYDPSKSSLHGLTTIRLVLHAARNVYEAIDLLRRYNNSFSDQTHYLLSDAYGNSVVIEYYDDDVCVTWKSGPFQISTNNRINGHQNDSNYWMSICARYWNLLRLLGDCNGVLSEESAFGLLRYVAPNPTSYPTSVRTVWSSVYNNTTGIWQLCLDRNYDLVYKFSLPMITDLSVNSVKFMTKTMELEPGANIRLFAKVKNNSIRPSKAAKIQFYLSKKKSIGKKSILLKNYDLASLAAEKEKKIRIRTSIPEDIRPGSYYLIAILDPEQANNDPDSENNIIVNKKRYTLVRR